DAVRVALGLEPPGAEAELEAAVADDVDRGGHVRQHRRVPVDHAGHLDADADALGRLGERGGRGPALQVGPVDVAGERIEGVPGAGALEDRDVVGRDPHVEDLLPGLVLRARLDAEPHAGTSLSYGKSYRNHRSPAGPGRP